MNKFIYSIVLSVLVSVWSFGQQTCATALVVTPGIHTVSAINGTEVPTLICASGGGGATLANWYKYTPTDDFTVTVSTDFVSNGNVDNRVHIYSGTCGNLVCEAGDDDGGTGLLCVASFTAEANTDYFIVFDNKWSPLGFQFEITEEEIILPDPSLVGFAAQNITSISGSYKIAVADMNGDYLDDIVSVSSNSVQIHYQGTDGSFAAVSYTTTPAQFLPTWSIAIGDYNGDGYNDLLYGGGNGVTFMKSNGTGTGYVQSSGSQYVFSQRSNFIDINNDGHLDAFVCHDVAPNVFYLNDGEGNLTFNQGGIGDHPNGGNYGSIWVDYNNDGLSDLFIAKCRGGVNTAKINELHRNNGDGTFTDVSIESNLADPIQTWSSAWNDFDNDGWMDVVVGASANSDGMHKFMRNLGDGTFENKTAGSGIDSFSGMSIEYVSYDFNNDGFADVFTNNAILFNNGNNTFTTTPFPMNVGAVGDLNNDGFLDVQNGNTIYYNTGNENNWLGVTLEGVESNRNGIGARLEIYGAWGKQIRDVHSGVGFRHMGTLNTHFGVGSATEIDSLIVRWPSGNVDVICRPDTNQILHVIENSGPVAIASFTADETVISATESVVFTDASSVCPTAWNWTIVPASGWEFTSGTSPNSQHPTIQFNLPGTYEVSLVTTNANGASTNESSESILVNSGLGIEIVSLNSFLVYPNPASEFIQLELDNYSLSSVKLISILGSEVETNWEKNTNLISIEQLQAGTYFIQATTFDGQLLSSRFVKK